MNDKIKELAEVIKLAQAYCPRPSSDMTIISDEEIKQIHKDSPKRSYTNNPVWFVQTKHQLQAQLAQDRAHEAAALIKARQEERGRFDTELVDVLNCIDGGGDYITAIQNLRLRLVSLKDKE